MDIPGLVLSAELESRVRDALDLISEAFTACEPAQIRNPWLASGLSGVALMHAYLDARYPERGHAVLSKKFFELAVDASADLEFCASLFEGHIGIAWLSDLFRGVEAPSNQEVDEAMLQELRSQAWDSGFDVVSGLCGVAIYALGRVECESSREILAQVIRHLEASAESTPEGISWLVQPDWIEAAARGDRTEPHVDFGLAHGVPGVISTLSYVLQSGIERECTRSMLEGAVAWVRSQRLPPGHPSIFPPHVGPSIIPRASRLAWCRGDLAVASALLDAAGATGNGSWEREAIEIGRAAALRDRNDCGVVDAGLCHGAFGASLLFHSLYRRTGDAAIGEAALCWLDRGLRLHVPGGALGGFRTKVGHEDGSVSWEFQPAWLTGASGIALVLHSFLAPMTFRWAAPLLLTSPIARAES